MHGRRKAAAVNREEGSACEKSSGKLRFY